MKHPKRTVPQCLTTLVDHCLKHHCAGHHGVAGSLDMPGAAFFWQLTLGQLDLRTADVGVHADLKSLRDSTHRAPHITWCTAFSRTSQIFAKMWLKPCMVTTGQLRLPAAACPVPCRYPRSYWGCENLSMYFLQKAGLTLVSIRSWILHQPLL
jgi:hypothetical protein